MAETKRRRLGGVLLFGALYCAVGVVFAEIGKSSHGILWRRLAWVVSAVAFGAHIIYELIVRGSTTRATATDVSVAAALGAGGLAIAANLHGWWTESYQSSLALAVVAWPLLVLIPAFVVAFVAAALLDRWRRRADSEGL
jgi:RsiW-degrading membrane proteinase PrsW (M82 family)